MRTSQLHIQRLNRLITRLSSGTACLGSPRIDRDERKLAVEVVQASHDVLGGLTASRVALGNAAIVTLAGRREANAAEDAIIAAERAVMRYREAVCTAAGDLKPWDAEAER